MELNVEEALRAKEHAEKLFAVKDFVGAKRSALKAQAFCPQLEGIGSMVATFETYAATVSKVNGEIDLYSVLGVDPSAKKPVLKRQYKKMAVLLHPNKNKTVGADEAFRLVSEAWTVLSDKAKRRSYDVRRNKNLYAMVNQSNVSSVVRTDTFWTVCTSCRVQYEYLRKYVNKRLSCKNCRGVFVAVETGAAPVAFCPWSYTTDNGLTNHSYTAPTHGSAAFHFQNGPDLTNNLSFQWNASAISGPNGFSHNSVNLVHTANGNVTGDKVNGTVPKLGRPFKKIKIEEGDAARATNIEKGSVMESGVGVNGVQNRWYSVNPVFDARKLLIDKARSVIRVKLEEIKSASKAKKSGKTAKKTMVIPDFHDFNMDRSQEVFKAKQIWAIYDEEDGMPRRYCLIREVLSLNPFQVYISYFDSKTDTEFGDVKWIESGFTKSCGSFRVFQSETVDQVNVFSHLLEKEKAGRGGCVRIYPKTGDIWAVYRNWSEKWDRKTPKEVVQQYEMVEVVGDYSDECGVYVARLVKLAGYKTVYQRDPGEHAVRWIPKREMLQFSHQVPSCMLKGETFNLPDGCWDLDPAATPEDGLGLGQATMEESVKSAAIAGGDQDC